MCKLHDTRPDLYAEVAAGRKRTPPHPYARISSYLRERHSLNVTANMIRDHFLLNHEERFR